MNLISSFFIVILITGCVSNKKIELPGPSLTTGGSELYKNAYPYNWQQRDSLVIKEILSGNIPQFFKKFVPLKVDIYDSLQGRKIHAVYYVSPDYLSFGNDADWVRVNITPMAAQQIGDKLNCFLPTKKIVDDIYKAATIKLEPVPLFAFRDSTPTMYHHHLIIEGQRKNRKGLIAGIKKDVVISGKLNDGGKKNKVAIYGWHKLDGKPIQPLYTGHVNWYVDYSHGIRLIHNMIKVEGKWMNYKDVLKSPVYHKLLCDEEVCSFFQYSY